MTEKKVQTEKAGLKSKAAEVGAPLEHIFLAGLGALSNAQKLGSKTFETLVEEGEFFRKDASEKTEALIGDIQKSIRNMAGDAQHRATGLIDQMRDRSQLEQLQNVFDSRVADAMDRLGVPSKNDIEQLNAKLDKILELVAKKPARKAPAKKKTTAKKKAEKPVKTPAKKAA